MKEGDRVLGQYGFVRIASRRREEEPDGDPRLRALHEPPLPHGLRVVRETVRGRAQRRAGRAEDRAGPLPRVSDGRRGTHSLDVVIRAFALVLILAASGCSTLSVPDRLPGGATPLPPFVHDDWDAFLDRHVDPEGRVAYAAARADRDELDRYVTAIAVGSPDTMPALFPSEPDRLAYWLNAYNAWTISLVLDHYPVASVHDIQTGFSRIVSAILPDGAGFFFFHRIELGGASTSLYSLENGVLRARFDDPRIHFALNCASLGCPRLPQKAFLGESLEDQLERETEWFLSEERNVHVDPEHGVVRLSSIFDWYAEDFTGWMERHVPDEPASLLGWVAHHLKGSRREELLLCRECRVEFVRYDWRLNDQAT